MSLLASLENVDLQFPKSARPALREIRWTIRQGGHCAVLGRNGSGKSSLLALLAGLLWPTRGKLLWYGPDGAEDSPIYGRSISALVSPAMQENCQRPAFATTFLDAMLGAFDQSPFSFASRDADPEHKDRALAVAEALACANLLPMPLYALSQGQMRILLCARALLRKPRLCLLDEALDGLDETRKAAFFLTLEKMAPETTVILASHRPESIPDFCEDRLYLEDGAQVAARNIAVNDSRKIEIGEKRPEPGRVLLDLENVNVFIDRALVLRNITWQTRQGEHWRIAGANGSGKSTLLRLLAGEECAASDGTIERWLPVLGGPARSLEDLRKGIRLVSDLSQALYAYDLTGLELVSSGFEQTIGLYRDFSPEEKDQALAALARFFPDGEGLRLAETSIRRMSTGQLRRMHLARALMGNPDILLLDEGATGLDIESRAEWFAMLERLAQAVQIIMVSHYDEDVPAFVNRRATMRDGRLFLQP